MNAADQKVTNLQEKKSPLFNLLNQSYFFVE